MLAALDARNGGLCLGFRSGDAWLPLARFGPDRSADEYAFLFEAAFLRAMRAAGAGSSSAPDAAPDKAWLSSVVPAMTPRLIEAFRLAFGLDARVVGPGVKTGVKIRTDQPAEVGSDLVCQAAAAYELVGGACVVVDFGVALTLAAVNEAGELLGASIAPGLQTAAWALRRSAAQLPQVRLEEPTRAIGRNSAEALRSGILVGYRGLVSALVAGMRAELGGAAALVGSGDELGRGILAALGCDRFAADLTLDGIAVIAARNEAAERQTR